MKIVDPIITRIATSRWKRAGVIIGKGARFVGMPLMTKRRGATIRIGEGFLAVSRLRDQVIGVNHRTIIRAIDSEAVISIGNNCGISGATIVSKNQITIGDGTLVGANAMIVDTDFHPVHSADRRFAEIPGRRQQDEIIIGSNVFIGANAMILKGTNIGPNSVVGAGAVVRGHLPAGSVCLGNPATVVGRVRTE